MKKFTVMVMTMFIAISLIGCSKQSDSSGWLNAGTYFDKDNELMMTASESKDAGNTGWDISIVGETVYIGFVSQQDNTLQGELVKEPETEKVNVTISKEGKDGYAVKLETGEEYHFVSTIDLKMVGTVSVNIKGSGQVAYALPDEEIVFSDKTPGESFKINVYDAGHYTFAAKEDEGWKFQHWKVNGDLFSQEKQVELYVDHDIELEAVFTKQ